jgi:hypothetical protein
MEYSTRCLPWTALITTCVVAWLSSFGHVMAVSHGYCYVDQVPTASVEHKGFESRASWREVGGAG